MFNTATIPKRVTALAMSTVLAVSLVPLVPYTANADELTAANVAVQNDATTVTEGDYTLTIEKSTYTYLGEPIEPDFTYVIDDKPYPMTRTKSDCDSYALKYHRERNYYYENNDAPGIATLVIGTPENKRVSINFTIEELPKIDLNSSRVSYESQYEATYSGKPVYAGSITINGLTDDEKTYIGNTTEYYAPNLLSSLTIGLDNIAKQNEYTASMFSVTPKNSVNVGKASAVIHGKGLFTGDLTVNYTISKLKVYSPIYAEGFAAWAAERMMYKLGWPAENFAGKGEDGYFYTTHGIKKPKTPTITAKKYSKKRKKYYFAKTQRIKLPIGFKLYGEAYDQMTGEYSTVKVPVASCKVRACNTGPGAIDFKASKLPKGMTYNAKTGVVTIKKGWHKISRLLYVTFEAASPYQVGDSKGLMYEYKLKCKKTVK